MNLILCFYNFNINICLYVCSYNFCYICIYCYIIIQFQSETLATVTLLESVNLIFNNLLNSLYNVNLLVKDYTKTIVVGDMIGKN